MGNFLSQFGKENRFINIENTKYLKLIPYHYGDSWLIAFFHSIFKFPAPYIYNYIVNPLLIFVYYIGCLAFIEKGLGQVKKIHIILIPLVVFFTSISMPIFDFLPGRLYQWSLINLPNRTKKGGRLNVMPFDNTIEYSVTETYIPQTKEKNKFVNLSSLKSIIDNIACPIK